MPEGHTIHRAAATLDRALGGKALVRFDAPRLRYEPFAPATIVEGAEAVGKHCLVHFDDGRTLRTHLRMTGSWHLYQPGERWRKKPAALRALVAVSDWVAVCFAAPDVELVRDQGVAATEHLGPDLCVAEPDLDDAARRLAAQGDREVGDALLDQRVACGVGNMWKSEALFVEGIDPFAPVSALTDDQRRAVLGAASQLLLAHVDRSADDHRVYGRRGQPCPRCGTPISWRAQGPHRRGTYWCPSCQAG